MVFSLEVISKSVLKGVFLVEKRECRRNLFSFHGHTMNSVIRKPYLVFNYVIKTHQFNPSQFFNPIPQVREKLHHEIDILHQLGWGYTKIHHHLVNNGFKIGESRTTVDKILKKMKKRETFLTQPIMDGFTEYSVEVYES